MENGVPAMHQTKKGNQWYFGMKAHIGVDSKSQLIHSVAATAVNAHDSQLLPDPLHGEETRVYGESAYTGQGEAIRKQAPRAKDFTQKKACRNRQLSDMDVTRNRTKSRVRAKVEHPFLVLKRIFGFNKVRYRGLDKNANRLFVACGLVNLYLVRGQLLRPT
jgi:IS5 family transposase